MIIYLKILGPRSPINNKNPHQKVLANGDPAPESPVKSSKAQQAEREVSYNRPPPSPPQPPPPSEARDSAGEKCIYFCIYR